VQLVLVLMLGAREQLYVGTLTGLSTRSLAEYRQTFFGLGCWLCDKERNDIGYGGVNNNNAHFRCDDLNVCYFGSLKRTTAADGYLNALLGHRDSGIIGGRGRGRRRRAEEGFLLRLRSHNSCL
jgi:hypothetical protein